MLVSSFIKNTKNIQTTDIRTKTSILDEVLGAVSGFGGNSLDPGQNERIMPSSGIPVDSAIGVPTELRQNHNVRHPLHDII